MACPSCTKNKQAANAGVFTTALNPHPFQANDIAVVHEGKVRKFQLHDWNNDRHKLLIFIPEAFTPVCQTELGAMNYWVDEFAKLQCEIIAVGTDNAYQFLEWYESEESLKNPNYKTFSSYLLPARLGVLENGRAKRASVFVTKEGDVVRQEHFIKVGRSFAELHRMLYGYTTDSYCAEGWTSPDEGFLTKRDG